MGETLLKSSLRVVLVIQKGEISTCVSKKKKRPKKAVVSKRPRGSSSFDYHRTLFVLADAEVRFHDSITRRVRLKERGFDIDVENPRIEDF